MRMALQSLEQHAESLDDDAHNTSNIWKKHSHVII